MTNAIIIDDLLKLDEFLLLEPGTSRAVLVDYDISKVELINESLAIRGVPTRLAADTSVMPAQRPAWTALMHSLGISRAWWMDGNPNIADLPDLRID